MSNIIEYAKKGKLAKTLIFGWYEKRGGGNRKKRGKKGKRAMENGGRDNRGRIRFDYRWNFCWTCNIWRHLFKIDFFFKFVENWIYIICRLNINWFEQYSVASRKVVFIKTIIDFKIFDYLITRNMPFIY